LAPRHQHLLDLCRVLRVQRIPLRLNRRMGRSRGPAEILAQFLHRFLDFLRCRRHLRCGCLFGAQSRSEDEQEAQQANAQPQPPSTSPLPAYRPPEPDLSIKYHVLLGLPPDLPQAKSGDFDAPASKTADIASSLITEFRRHLRTCSRLPESIAASDKGKVTLRVLRTRAGRLAAEPILIEARASTKGPALLQGAITALQACQPYAMLPAERYGEWKVLDLSFTPQDFSGSS